MQGSPDLSTSQGGISFPRSLLCSLDIEGDHGIERGIGARNLCKMGVQYFCRRYFPRLDGCC
jgi:hypothetical protein